MMNGPLNYKIQLVVIPFDKKKSFSFSTIYAENERHILEFTKERMLKLYDIFPAETHDIQIQYIQQVEKTDKFTKKVFKKEVEKKLEVKQ